MIRSIKILKRVAVVLILMSARSHAESMFMLDSDEGTVRRVAPSTPPPPKSSPAVQAAARGGAKPASKPSAIFAPLGRFLIPEPPPDLTPEPRPRPGRRPQPDDDTEGGVITVCPNCTVNKNIADLQAVVNGELRISQLATWKRSRGLVQIPTKGRIGNIGPCGSFHYNPGSEGTSELKDNWSSPTAACVMMSVLQEWKQSCPDSQAGCRIAWGDISHKTDPGFHGVHKSHTNGHCWDFRPMQNGSFVDDQLTYSSSDSVATIAFIKLLKSKGTTDLIYNDPKARRIARTLKGHSNHIHACFKPTKKTKAVCKAYRYDPAICGPG